MELGGSDEAATLSLKMPFGLSTCLPLSCRRVSDKPWGGLHYVDEETDAGFSQLTEFFIIQEIFGFFALPFCACVSDATFDASLARSC